MGQVSHPWHFNFMWDGTPYRFSLDKYLGRHIDNKTDAETEAEHIRLAIKAGRFGQPTPRDEMTLRQLADLYLERYVRVEHASTEQAFVWAFNTICGTLIPRPVGGDAPLGGWRWTSSPTPSNGSAKSALVEPVWWA